MLKKFGHSTTTMTGELNRIGSELFGTKYLGAFAGDALPDEIYNKPTKYAILNVDLKGMPGSHWTAVAGLPNSDKILVFDSFSRAAKTLLPHLRQKNVINADLSDSEQKTTQLSCGQFSMGFLLFVDRYGFANGKLI